MDMTERERIEEDIEDLKSTYNTIKRLTKSPAPIIKDNAINILAILRDLLANVDPNSFEYIVEYE